MLKRLTTTKFVGALLLSAFLAGCATQTDHATTTIDTSMETVKHSAKVYVNEAQNTQDTGKQQRYLLLAAHAYINEGNYDAANKVLRSLKLGNDSSLLAQQRFLSAIVTEKTTSVSAAIKQLNYPSQWQLPRWQMANYYQYKANLYQRNNQPIDQARQLSFLSQYVSKDEAVLVNDDIWNMLQPLHEETLRVFMNDKSNPIFSGWLQLAYIAKHYAVTPSQLVSYLGQWQQQNPSHPAAIQLPTDLEQALNARPFNPQTVAVLLPLSGNRATVAEPIKQGIMASYLSQQTQFDLQFFDTEKGIAAAYQQAEQAEVDFIIGPLFAQDVETLHQLQAEQTNHIPQLFLNQVDKFEVNPNQFYFSLSPAQEASDAAFKMFNDGVKQPLIFASNNSIGKRMAESFIEAWTELAETDVEVHYYDSGDQMRVTVKQALGVSESEARIQRIKELIGNNTEADFRSRQDIDAIYMVSGAQDLILLKPFLDVNFSVFSKPIALYTSSRGRVSTRDGQATPELNGTMMSDIPWLMQSSNETRMVNQLWHTWSNSKKRLFVMGFDSVELINRLAQMRAFPGYQFNGRSGVLTVNPQGVIDRQLSWGKYVSGNLRPL
ncbi:penicillin-binding protein activator [Shewanella maritima]|uniref:penicillin-binding protein activator n=1 Tax=Shewanella maritima TaxID=2520507 RepID=UPI003735DBDC